MARGSSVAPPTTGKNALKTGFSSAGWLVIIGFVVVLIVLFVQNLSEPRDLGVFPLVGAVMFGPLAAGLALIGFGLAALVPPRNTFLGVTLVGFGLVCLALAWFIVGFARNFD